MKNSIAQRSADASGRSNLMQGDVLHIVFVHVVHHGLEGVVVYIPVDEIIPVEISAFIDSVHDELPDLKEGFGDLKFIPQSLSLKKKHKFLHFCCVPVSVSEMEKRDFFICDYGENGLGLHRVVGAENAGMQDCDDVTTLAGRRRKGVVQLIRVDKQSISFFQKDLSAVDGITHAGGMNAEKFDILVEVGNLLPGAAVVNVTVVDVGRKGCVIVVDDFGTVLSCPNQPSVFVYHYFPDLL
jgi:hypothetical protein